MSLLPRLIVSVLIAGAIFIGIIKLMGIPPESYLPPPDLYSRATSSAHGYITGEHTAGFGDHLLEGSHTFYYMDYKFQPSVMTVKPDGKKVETQESTWQKGTVRIGEQTYMQIKTSEPVKVWYDPVAPRINGVAGTMGIWNIKTGYLNPYLWWYVGLLIAIYAIQETIRAVTKTIDY